MAHSDRTITTVIPTFRRPRLLARAISSVLAQRHQDVRICVFDNASGDSTADVVRQFASNDSRVVYVERKENIGAFANFCAGLATVDTPFFSFLSDDDYVLPDFYERAMNHFRGHPDSGFVVMGVLNANSRGDLFNDGAMRGCKAGFYPAPSGMLRMVDRGAPTWTGILFRTEVRNRIGLPKMEYGAAFDLTYVLHAAKCFPYFFDPTPAAVFVPASLTQVASVRGSVSQYWPGWASTIDLLTVDDRFSAETRFWLASRLTRWLQNRMFALALVALTKGDRATATSAVQVLDDNFPGSTTFLRLLLRLCNSVPGMFLVLRAANRVRAGLLAVQQRRRSVSVDATGA